MREFRVTRFLAMAILIAIQCLSSFPAFAQDTLTNRNHNVDCVQLHTFEYEVEERNEGAEYDVKKLPAVQMNGSLVPLIQAFHSTDRIEWRILFPRGGVRIVGSIVQIDTAKLFGSTPPPSGWIRIAVLVGSETACPNLEGRLWFK